MPTASEDESVIMNEKAKANRYLVFRQKCCIYTGIRLDTFLTLIRNVFVMQVEVEDK